MPRHAGLVGQQRDLRETFDHHAQKDIVRDLADPGELALSDIRDALRSKDLDQRPRGPTGVLRPRDDGGQLSGSDRFGVAADGSGHEGGAALRKAAADHSRFLDADRRAVDKHPRQLAVFSCRHSIFSKQHLLDVTSGRHDREQHVDIGEIRRSLHDPTALTRKPLGFGARPVPDGQIVAGGQSL